jgi:GT2 family glycosyltransferase
MSLAAVIVTFNRLEKLKQTIANTLSEDVQFVVVVNNASTDETATWLESLEDDRLLIVNLPKNIGGAGGFHVGFKAVLGAGDLDWLVCYDDDAYPQVGAFTQFKELNLPESVAGVAASVYLPSGEIAEMNRPSINPFGSLKSFLSTVIKGRMGFHVDDGAYSQKRVDIDASSFVGCFVRISAIKSCLGLPRSELFIYADDIIYTLGITACGLRHQFVPSVKFTHDCLTLVNQQAVYKPLWRAYYTYRNGLEMYRKVAGWFFPIVVLIKAPSWLLKAKYYEDPACFRRIVWLSIKDGLNRDFSRKHEDVLRLSKCEKN